MPVNGLQQVFTWGRTSLLHVYRGSRKDRKRRLYLSLRSRFKPILVSVKHQKLVKNDCIEWPIAHFGKE